MCNVNFDICHCFCLVPPLNISYIFDYVFYKNPPNGNVSTTYLANNLQRAVIKITHTHLESLHIFLESNSKLLLRLTKFEVVHSS